MKKKRGNGEGALYSTILIVKRKEFKNVICNNCKNCNRLNVCKRNEFERCDKCKNCKDCLEYCDRYYAYEKWIAQGTIKGKRTTLGTGKKQKDASQKKNEKKEKEIKGLLFDKNNATILDIATQLAEDLHKTNKLADTSYKRKLETIKEISGHYIASIPIQNISELDLRDFSSYITKYSNSVIEKIWQLVKKVLNKAVKKKLIPYNFMLDTDDFPIPKSSRPDKKVHALSISDHKKLVEILKNDDKDKIEYKYQYLLSLTTDMRMGEINALDIDQDIDFKNKVIHIRRTITKDINDKPKLGIIPKTHAGHRDIKMDPESEAILKKVTSKWIPNKLNLLFYNYNKDHVISTAQVNSAFKRLCEKYDIDKGWDVNQHMLRHTGATRDIESGMPANVLQRKLGHADVATTLNTYCDVFAEFEEKHRNDSYQYQKTLGVYVFSSNNELENKIEINNLMKTLEKKYINNPKVLKELLENYLIT